MFLNADFSLGWVQLFLPSEVFTEWVPYGDTVILFQHMNADKFQIKNAIEMTVASPAGLAVFLTFENKWIYLNQASYATFLLFVGVPTSYAELFPEGLYIRFVIVGN